jgi:hypothetical protein
MALTTHNRLVGRLNKIQLHLYNASVLSRIVIGRAFYPHLLLSNFSQICQRKASWYILADGQTWHSLLLFTTHERVKNGSNYLGDNATSQTCLRRKAVFASLRRAYYISFCPSVCTHDTTRESPNGFPLTSDVIERSLRHWQRRGIWLEIKRTEE